MNRLVIRLPRPANPNRASSALIILLGALAVSCAGSHRPTARTRNVPTELSTRLEWPVAEGRILSGFGALRGGHQHKGIDIGGNPGQPVRAAMGGRIVYSGSTLRGYGKTVIIDHGDDLQSLYAHNSTLLVKEGERVVTGQVVARVGRTGNATTEHCHFEVRERDVAVDPLRYLNDSMGSTR